MSDRLWYVYAVVPATMDVAGAPVGIDGAAVRLVTRGDHGALVSEVSSTAYDPTRVESLAGDVEWIAPRAVAHDRVATWASDQGVVAPLPIFSIFSDRAAVERMLEERRAELTRVLALAARGREYMLRVFRVDAELLPRLGELSESVGSLERAADGASPGQAYLLSRKLEKERKDELQRIGAEKASEVHAALSSFAVSAARDALPRPKDSAAAAAVLAGAYLVSSDGLDAFRAELTRMIERDEGRGFRFEFTGPWPPYHFVRELDGGTA